MLKLNILLLIVVCLMPIIINAQDYIPPSDKELLNWFQSLSEEEQIAEIRKLDIIENTIPDLIFPIYSAVLNKTGDLIIFPVKPVATIKIDYLCYEINLPEYKIDNFYIRNEKDLFDYMVPSIFGIGIGVFGTAIGKGEKIWQYLLSAGQGAVFGFLITLSY